jgi:hypothetical protein
VQAAKNAVYGVVPDVAASTTTTSQRKPGNLEQDYCCFNTQVMIAPSQVMQKAQIRKA